MDRNQLRNERRKAEYVAAINRLPRDWRGPAMVGGTIMAWIGLSKPGKLPNYLRERIARHLPVLRAALKH
jgi:hypothetical protein